MGCHSSALWRFDLEFSENYATTDWERIKPMTLFNPGYKYNTYNTVL